ncbi:S-adenosyl-L-methionine-dependent methyltransferase [Phyllosticta citricarpa]
MAIHLSQLAVHLICHGTTTSWAQLLCRSAASPLFGSSTCPPRLYSSQSTGLATRLIWSISGLLGQPSGVLRLTGDASDSHISIMCNDSSAAGQPSHPAAGNNQMYPGAATATEIHIPVEDDGDSAYGEDDAISDTTSVASTIWKHRFENGRRGPNDDAQNDQLDIGVNRMILKPPYDEDSSRRPAALGALVGRASKDLGCGDFADEHPSAEVIGTDLSPIQPAFVPPNVKFEVDDCTQPWMYLSNHFDLIHIRCLYGSISDWPAFYREAYDFPPNSALLEWSDLFIGSAEKFGKTMRVIDNMKRWITDTGFQEVSEVRYKVPVGPWSSDTKLKEPGKWNMLYCYHGCEGWAMFLLTHVLGWKPEEVQLLVARFKQALKDKKTHAYYEM